MPAILVTSSFLPGRGGIETYLAALCADLSPQLAVMAARERDGLPLPHDLGYETIGGQGSMLFPTPRLRSAIAAAARSHGTDRVLFGTPWPLGLLAPALASEGIRYGMIVHGAEMMVPATLPLVRRRLARALAGADLLLPVSRFTADKVVTLLRSSGYELPEIEVMHARVDLDRYSPVAGNEQARQRLRLSGGPLLLHLGRLVKRKGVDRAIKAMPAITHMVPGATLLVAGTGPEEGTLRRVAARHRARVRFLGRVDERDVPALYALADVFILPVADRWFGLEVEGLGVVLLEAQACGTPCVTGHSGGTPEAVIDGATGFVVDGRDQGALVDAIVRLLRDGDLRTRMGRAGRAHVEKHFGGHELPRSLLGWLQASHQ